MRRAQFWRAVFLSLSALVVTATTLTIGTGSAAADVGVAGLSHVSAAPTTTTYCPYTVSENTPTLEKPQGGSRINGYWNAGDRRNIEFPLHVVNSYALAGHTSAGLGEWVPKRLLVRLPGPCVQ